MKPDTCCRGHSPNGMVVYRCLLALLTFLCISASSTGYLPISSHLEAELNLLSESAPLYKPLDLNLDLATHLSNSVFVSQPTVVSYCPDRNQFGDFDFKSCGFSVIAKGAFGIEFFDIPEENEESLTKTSAAVSNFVQEWGRQAGFEFDSVAMTGGWVFRDLDPANLSSQKGYHFVHTDFPEGQTETTIKSFSTQAWDELEARRLEVVQIVNIWLPLNKEPNNNTLTVMDISKLDKDNLKIVDVTANFGQDQKYFKSVYLTSAQGLDGCFYAFPVMRGDAIIFDSERTPHSAFYAPPGVGSSEPRRSVEYRAFFVKQKQ